MVAEPSSGPGVEEQRFKLEVDEFMKTINLAEITPVPDSDCETEGSDENAELDQLKALDLKEGIQPEKMRGGAVEFA